MTLFRTPAGCGSVLLALGLFLTSCSNDKTERPSAAAQTLPQVETTAVIPQKLTSTERLPAQLLPYESVDLFAKETGFVKSISVDRGSSVRRGDLIARLEAPELAAQRAQASASYESVQSQLAAAQAKLAADHATYEHMSDAAKVPGVVAANDLDLAQRTAEADAANVEALRKGAAAAQEGVRAVEQLESYLNITAPFDGQVTTRYVHPGALVGPAGGPGAMTPMVRIETTTRHRLVVPVPENDVAGIPEGTVVSFTVPSFPGRTFRAPIARVSREVDLKTRTMPVELDVRDPHGELIPGTFCQVEWPIRRTYATLFVPAAAVTSNLERTFVLRVSNNRIEWVDVKTGASAGNLMEVFGDLREGDQVAVRGTDQLRAGAQVAAHAANSR